MFELCSPYNKVVRNYDAPTLFLLAGFAKNGYECHEVALDTWAEALHVQRPKRYSVSTIQQCIDWLESQDDPTFEGFVLRDRNGMRLKIKNTRYVALHHLKDNGNLFNPKNMLPLVLSGEVHETLLHFPEGTEAYFDMVEKLYGVYGRTNAVWEMAKGIESQKDFALFVNKHSDMKGLLFEARKRKVEAKSLFKDYSDLLLKNYFKKDCHVARLAA